MQTFLPYPEDFKKCAVTLDNTRLSKQLDDAYQIIQCITNKITYNYHPVIYMWVGYNQALKYYYNCILDELYERKRSIGKPYEIVKPVFFPYWLNNPLIKISHQSNLTRKDPYHYPFKDYGLIGYY